MCYASSGHHRYLKTNKLRKAARKVVRKTYFWIALTISVPGRHTRIIDGCTLECVSVARRWLMITPHRCGMLMSPECGVGRSYYFCSQNRYSNGERANRGDLAPTPGGLLKILKHINNIIHGASLSTAPNQSENNWPLSVRELCFESCTVVKRLVMSVATLGPWCLTLLVYWRSFGRRIIL